MNVFLSLFTVQTLVSKTVFIRIGKDIHMYVGTTGKIKTNFCIIYRFALYLP